MKALRAFSTAGLLLTLSIEQSFAKEAVTLEAMEKTYKSGACEEMQIPTANKRYASLVFIEDVLMGATGGDSVTNDFIGNMEVFKIGRTPDETLVDLYAYADRKDVRLQIKKDITSIDKAIKKEGTPNKKEIDTGTAIYCNIYKMAIGENYTFKNDLSNYLESLSRKMAHRNIDKLQKLINEQE